jgi:hypothetical protein
MTYRGRAISMPDRETHCRGKDFACETCHGKGHILANLDNGTILFHDLPSVCHTKALCLEKTARGVFDRQFGETLIRPTFPGG